MYELPQELPKELRFRIFEKIRIDEKSPAGHAKAKF